MTKKIRLRRPNNSLTKKSKKTAKTPHSKALGIFCGTALFVLVATIIVLLVSGVTNAHAGHTEAVTQSELEAQIARHNTEKVLTMAAIVEAAKRRDNAKKILERAQKHLKNKNADVNQKVLMMATIDRAIAHKLERLKDAPITHEGVQEAAPEELNPLTTPALPKHEAKKPEETPGVFGSLERNTSFEEVSWVELTQYTEEYMGKNIALTGWIRSVRPIKNSDFAAFEFGFEDHPDVTIIVSRTQTPLFGNVIGEPFYLMGRLVPSMKIENANTGEDELLEEVIQVFYLQKNWEMITR